MKVKRIPQSLILILVLCLTGCRSEIIETDLDLASSIQVFVLARGHEIVPRLGEQERLVRFLENWLPRMKKNITTYPPTEYRLKVIGKSRTGENVEEIILVGSNWIGDGDGFAILADTQAFGLGKLIEEIIARQSVDTRFKAAP